MSCPKITVIIPIYNAEAYVMRCLTSIACQNINNYEVYLIDDGSTDQSGEICDQFVRKDSRFKVFHKSNGGVSSARNLGVEKANGEWLYFLDADDWIEPEYIGQFVNGTEGDDIDLVIQSYDVEGDEGVQSPRFPDKEIKKAYQVVELLERTKYTHCGWLWHRLFKREIIHREGLRFREDISLGEDEIFFLDYIKYVRRTRVLSSKGHHYMMHPGGLTLQSHSLSYFYDLLLHYQYGIDNIDGNWWFNHVFKKIYINKFIDLWFVFFFSKYPFKEEVFKPLFSNLRTFVLKHKLYLIPCQSLFAFSYRYSLIIINNPRVLYWIWWKIKRVQNIWKK